MSVRTTRLAFALAICSLLLAQPASASDELRFSELEQRLAALEDQLASQQGVQTAAYLSGGETASCNCQPQGCYDCYGDCHYGQYYAHVELFWARLHLAESAVGKLSESHEVAPRIVMGFEDACGIGGRIRYWHYSEDTEILNEDEELAFDMDVLDLEGTNHFRVRTTDVTFGAGMRWADVEIWEDGDNADNSMFGLTMAGDLRTRLYHYCGHRIAGVYGGRLSLLGGNWDGDGNDVVDTMRDDNFVVHELYSGLEYSSRSYGYNWYTRFVVEMQTWESDALEEVDKFSFVGPSWHVGARY